MFKRIIFILTFLVLMTGVSFSAAQGDLDSTFGIGGIATHNGPANRDRFGYEVAIQSGITESQFRAADYFPILPGTTWTYMVDSVYTLTSVVLDERVNIRGVDTAVFLYLESGAKEFYTSDSNGIRLHRIFLPDALYIPGQGYINLSTTFIPPLTLADGLIEIGDTFNSSGIVRTNNLPGVGVLEFAYDATFTFEALDSVSVPAGNFDVLRIYGTVTIEGETGSQTFYLAKHIGIVKTTSTNSDGDVTTWELISTNAGYVQLLVPNGGEVASSGSTYNISWEASQTAVSFKLMYSADNGLTWNLITPTTVAGTSHDWNVPKPWGNKKACLVKVIGYNSSGERVGADRSDAPFTIEVVKLTSPNGGLTYKSGDPLTITWKTNATKRPVAKVKLYYTKDGGANWIPIKTLIDAQYLTTGSHSFDWTPTVKSKKTQCKVKVELKDAFGNILGADGSDSYFTIKPGSVLLKRTPFGGFYALGTAPPPESNTYDNVLTPLAALIDNNFNTGIATINLSTQKYHNIGILVSSAKSVDRLFIYVNKDFTLDTNLVNPNNWRVYRSNSNAVGTWQQIAISDITISFDTLNNIFRYEIRFSTPQNASFFKAVNRETVNAIGVTDVLVTEIEAYGTD